MRISENDQWAWWGSSTNTSPPGEKQHASPEGLAQVGLDQHLAGGPFGHRPSVEQEDAVTAGGVVEVVRRHQDGVARPAFLLDHLEDRLAGDDIQAGHRLVEEQDVSFLRQALGHEDPLALPPGEVVQLAVGQIGDVESIQGGLHHGVILGVEAVEQAALGVARHPHRLAHGDRERPIHIGGLEHERDGHAVPGDHSGGSGCEVGDGAQQRGLSGTVGADDRDGRTALDLQAHVVQCEMVAVADGEVVDRHREGHPGERIRKRVRFSFVSPTVAPYRESRAILTSEGGW